MSGKKRLQKGAISWAFYDWANSAFYTTVVAGFFPVFFKDYWSKGVEATISSFWLGVSVTTAGLIVSLSAPILGALADRGSAKKKFLLFFASIGILTTAMLAFIPEGAWPLASGGYVISYASILFSLIFYDSLIVSVSDSSDVDRISGLGFALGYLGGGLLFAINVAMTLKPDFFGIDSPVTAIKISFLMVSVWWAVFTIPLILRVDEPAGEKIGLRQASREGFAQLINTFKEIRKLRHVFLFLLAYWFYIDGVDTVITMAVDYGKAIGLKTSDLIGALLMVQFVAFPFAYLFGWLGQQYGAKRFIFIGIGIYIFVTILGYNLDTGSYTVFGFQINKFFAIAFLVGTVQGGIQALSRSLFTRLIPQEKSAQFFGFYNMVGKFAAIIGPIMMGSVGRITGNPRLGILSVSILFFIGAYILKNVPSVSHKNPTI